MFWLRGAAKLLDGEDHLLENVAWSWVRNERLKATFYNNEVNILQDTQFLPHYQIADFYHTIRLLIIKLLIKLPR